MGRHVELDLEYPDDINRLSELPDVILDAVKEAIDDFKLWIEEELQDNLYVYDLGGGALSDGISITALDNGFYIEMTATDDIHGGLYAAYVEYGTGYVGKTGEQHPLANEHGWIYDINEHGRSGWWYPTNENDPNPNIKTTKDGQMYGWTRGEEARPFMYDTWLWASENVVDFFEDAIEHALWEWE